MLFLILWSWLIECWNWKEPTGFWITFSFNIWVNRGPERSRGFGRSRSTEPGWELRPLGFTTELWLQSFLGGYFVDSNYLGVGGWRWQWGGGMASGLWLPWIVLLGPHGLRSCNSIPRSLLLRRFGAVFRDVGKGGGCSPTDRHACLPALRSEVNELSVSVKVSPQEMIMKLILGV